MKVTANFPEPCRFVLETFREIYRYDAVTRKQGMSPEERLAFHQEHSKPVMDKLRAWLDAQFEERLVEPNSGLGQAISYLLNHWQKLTLFLEKAGVPLDNNIVTAARGSDDVMPRPGLCRAAVMSIAHSRRISNFHRCTYRHNHRPSRNASKESGGRNRGGTRLLGVACASALSFNCISACRYI